MTSSENNAYYWQGLVKSGPREMQNYEKKKKCNIVEVGGICILRSCIIWTLYPILSGRENEEGERIR
jgi:hypothetical protein